MSYEMAEVIDANITYCWLVAQVTSGCPSDNSGLQGGTEQVMVVDKQVVIGGDIVIAVNRARITGIDSLSTYLEEHTLPGQIVDLTVIRNNETINMPLELEQSPDTNT